MSNSTAFTQTTNLVPVQGIFGPEPTYQLINLVGPAGSTFYPVAADVAITNDTTTNAEQLLVWVTASSGNLPAYVSSTKLKFNPSTGVLTATGGAGGGTF